MRNKYAAYPEYKNSGVDWLGKIPKHWTLTPMKFLASINPKKSSLKKELLTQKCSFLPMEKLKLNSITLDEERLISDVFGGYTYFENGDVLMAKVTPCFENKNIAVASGLTNGIGFGSSEIYVLRSASDVDGRFLYYRLQENSFMDIATAAMTGAGGLKRVPTDVISGYTLAIPALSEQNLIASFLDYETARIDRLIEKQQQLIELLKEKRQAVISHAVTKGLSVEGQPDVPMKDSGVEWLGQVPEHWVLSPLKYHCTFSGGGTPSKDNLDYWNGDIPWVSPKDMKNSRIYTSEDKITKAAIKESSTNLIDSGALLMVVRSGILQRTIPVAINMIPVTLNQDMKACRFSNSVYAEFLALLVQGFEKSLLLCWRKQGATVESLEHEYVANSLFPFPPIEEISSIIDLLSAKLKQFQLLMDKAEYGIELLKERRTALISAAVTGKIDVRSWVRPEESSTSDAA